MQSSNVNTFCVSFYLLLISFLIINFSPALIETPFFEKTGRNMEVLRNEFSSVFPIQRSGNVSDTTAACLYLASDAASYITGVTLPVDGGILNVSKY